MREHAEAKELYERARVTHPALPAEWPVCPKCGGWMFPEVCLDYNEWHWGWICEDCYWDTDMDMPWPFDKELASFEDWKQIGFEATQC